MFAIDPRSLAVFRMGVALLLLCDLFDRARDLHAFYTDDGLLPRIARLEMLGYGDPLGFQHQWSLHMLNGQAWSQALLIGIAAWFAVWLLVGHRAQLAAIVSWVLLLSIDNRNPLITDCGDSILRAMLFWSLFLPLGLTWSMDWAIRGSTPEGADRRPIQSTFSAVLLLQLAMMYWVSAAFKWHPVWIQELSAVYYALQADTLATSWGLVLREHPTIMQWLTGATMVLEIGGPLLAFSPWRNRWCRGIAIVAFAAFHLGLAITLTLGLFPWICINAWLLFVPASFWDWFEQRQLVQRITARFRRGTHAMISRLPADWKAVAEWRSEQPRADRSGWRQVAVGLLFLYIVTWNVREILGASWVDRVMPHRFNGLACALGLAQNWSVFAPVPRTDDGWLVMKGTLRDGSEVNLWKPGQPLPFDKPQLVSGLFPSSRWRSYLSAITLDHYAFHRHYLANWLQRRWDREQSGGIAERTVAKVELIRQIEVTPPPGEPIPQPDTVELCVRHY